MRIIRIAPLAALALVGSASIAGAQQSRATHTHAAATATAHRHETQADLEKEARITMADARAIALKTVPGATIQTGELEREGGKLIYSFDLKTAGKTGIDEVNIDATTGTVLGNKHETPKDERKEAAADRRAARKHAHQP